PATRAIAVLAPAHVPPSRYLERGPAMPAPRQSAPQPAKQRRQPALAGAVRAAPNERVLCGPTNQAKVPAGLKSCCISILRCTYGNLFQWACSHQSVQSPQRACQNRLRVAFTLAEQRGQFGVRVTFELVQHENGACAWRQTRQQRPCVYLVRRLIAFPGQVCELQFGNLFAATTLSTQVIDASIHCHSFEPRAERRVATVAANGVYHFQKYFLHQIFGVLTLTEHAQCQTEARPSEPLV